MKKDAESGPLLRVNPLACDAHGLCIQALPEMIGPDPWGYPVLSPHPVPAHLLAHARRAVELCPTLALMLTGPRPEQKR
jgi:ferredoxin